MEGVQFITINNECIITSLELLTLRDDIRNKSFYAIVNGFEYQINKEVFEALAEHYGNNTVMKYI